VIYIKRDLDTFFIRPSGPHKKHSIWQQFKRSRTVTSSVFSWF